MSEDFGSDFVTIIDDEGNEFELEVIESMDYNGHSYMAFLPADMSEDDPDYGFVLLRVVEDEKKVRGSLVLWLRRHAPNVGDTGSIPGRELRSCLPQGAA